MQTVFAWVAGLAWAFVVLGLLAIGLYGVVEQGIKPEKPFDIGRKLVPWLWFSFLLGLGGCVAALVVK